MTVIVSVKINDGIVMASDSASSFAIGQTYNHANKIVNLRKGFPIGAMVTGQGGIGSESIETMLKDLRARFTGDTDEDGDWYLQQGRYTLEVVAARVHEFLARKVAAVDFEVWMKLRICGYSAGRPLAEVWEVNLSGRECSPPVQIQSEADFGPRWDGEYEALNRLILGVGIGFHDIAARLGASDEQAQQYYNALTSGMHEVLCLPAMPIQDAIDLARYLVETTAGYIKFAVKRPKTVGGPVAIAAITKHEGFRWVQRKHFYSAELNPA